MASTTSGGTLTFKVDGRQYELAGSFSYDLGGVEREDRVGPDGVHPPIQKFRAPMLDAELNDGAKVSLAALSAINGVTLNLALGNGKRVVFYQAYQKGDLANDVIEAKIKAKFGSQSAREFT